MFQPPVLVPCELVPSQTLDDVLQECSNADQIDKLPWFNITQQVPKQATEAGFEFLPPTDNLFVGECHKTFDKMILLENELLEEWNLISGEGERNLKETAVRALQVDHLYLSQSEGISPTRKSECYFVAFVFLSFLFAY